MSLEPRGITSIGALEDAELIQADRDKLKVRLSQEESDFGYVMSTPAGRRFVAEILLRCHHDPNHNESHSYSSFILGQQVIGHWLESRLRDYCLDAMRLMEDEVNES